MQLLQPITYWTAVPTGTGGFTFGSPTALLGFWEEKQELAVDAYGVQIISRAVVYVDTEVAVNGYLYLGTSTAVDPTTLADAWQIKNYMENYNVRNTEILRKAIL